MSHSTKVTLDRLASLPHASAAPMPRAPAALPQADLGLPGPPDAPATFRVTVAKAAVRAVLAAHPMHVAPAGTPVADLTLPSIPDPPVRRTLA